MKFARRTLMLALCAATLSACTHRPPPPPAVTLPIAQTERGVMIWLPDNVMFEFGKSELSPAAADYLREVAQLALTRTDKALALEGHTDNVGSASFNQTLSEKRAQAVAAALASQGVPAARMEVKGLGLESPIAPNDSETGRRLNRRVEIIVLNETVERLTAGAPANAFEDAFARLRRELGDAVEQKGLK
jgi:flagellar motor protein MotB